MSARSVALAVARDVFAPAAAARNAQESLDYHLRKESLDGRDRGLATQLAFGAIKMRRLCEWYLRPYISGRESTLPPVIGEILRLAVFELVTLRSAPHGVVNEWVGLAKRFGHRGTAGLVNAVLRGFLRDEPAPPSLADFPSEDDFLATAHSYPTWIVKQLRAAFGGEKLEDVLQAANAPPQPAVRVNTLKMDVAAARAWFSGQGVSADQSAFVEEVLLLSDGAFAHVNEAAAHGNWAIQSESAAMPVDIMNPQPGEAVLDLCSGRGNKALQIASRLHGDGSLTCVEKDEKKAAILERRLDEGNAAAALVRGDAREPLLDARFERVMVDAPCSGIGLLGRHPETRWRKRPDDGSRLQELQRELLEAAAARVHPGGVLVYAVCSTDPCEGPQVVESFLRQNNFARGLVPARYEPLLTGEGDVRLAPGLHGRDGFYIARLERGA